VNLPEHFVEGHVEPTLRQKVERMEVEMLEHPQVPIVPVHYFGDGVYAREITIPKDTLLTGKIHKYEQINILSKGDISVLTDKGVVRVQAPFTVVSPSGTKRIAYAHEECVWTTILRTDLTDPDEIEDYFVVDTDRQYLEFRQSLLGVKT
jgi:hypothetical protein